MRKAIEEANKDKPPRLPRPARVINSADELERAVNRLFDLLNAEDDLDLRQQQVERLVTLLKELSAPIKAPAVPPPVWPTEVAAKPKRARTDISVRKHYRSAGACLVRPG